MSEWRLYEAGTVPEWTTVEFFREHPWIDPVHQVGHAERLAMVSDLVHRFVRELAVTSIVDLGSGDGSLLRALSDIDVPMWGYDAGLGNVATARRHGTDVRHADIFTDPLEYGDLIICTEVIEHLVDPHGFVAALPGRAVVLSSPAKEDADWHYCHHAWAWDEEGYRALATGAGWEVVWHVTCDAPAVEHVPGVSRQQGFQAVVGVR